MSASLQHHCPSRLFACTGVDAFCGLFHDDVHAEERRGMAGRNLSSGVSD